MLLPFYNILQLVYYRKERSKKIKLAKAILGNEETVEVRRGPFKGQLFINDLSRLGFHLFPKVIGSYESELFPWIKAIENQSYSRIINVGSGDGYYAVGLSKLFPQAEVYAIDKSSVQQKMCVESTLLNNEPQIIVQSDFSPALLSAEKKQLIFMDCEGCEEQLLDLSSLLLKSDLIIETHNHIVPGISEKLISVFSQSHHISEVVSKDGVLKVNLTFNELLSLSLNDQIMLLNEGRPCSSEWLFLQSKS